MNRREEPKLKRQHGSRGQILPLVGLLLVTITGMGAAAIDVGSLDYQWQRQQSATDAAAVAGAQALIANGCPSQPAAQTAALQDATTNNFGPSSSVQVTVNNPPSFGPYSTSGGEPAAGANCAVQVQVTVPHTPTYLLGLLGFSAGMPETTQAVAQMQSTNNTCIYALSPDHGSWFEGVTLTAPTCGILLNGSGYFAGATIDASPIGVANGINGTGTYPLIAPTPMAEAQDPCPEIIACNYIAQNPPSCSAYQNNVTFASGSTIQGATSGSAGVNVGCYGNITIGPGTVTVDGTITLNGTVTWGGAAGSTTTLNTGPDGVTFYVTANGTAPKFQSAAGGGSLTPPTTGNYANVLYYQVPANTTSPNFGASGPNMQGLIYAPSAIEVNYWGTTNNVILVFAQVVMTTIGTENATTTTIPAWNPQIIQQVVLVE
jgi:hypothetical protein